MRQIIEKTEEALNIKIEPMDISCSYKDVEATDEGKAKIDKCVERWSAIGFTKGLEKEMARRCSFAFEQMAYYLLHVNEDDMLKGDYETVVFPIIRRTVTVLDDADSFSTEKLIEWSKKVSFEEILAWFTDCANENGVSGDFEAETCAMVSDIMIQAFDEPSRDIEEIKNEVIEKVKKIIEAKGSE